MIFIKPSFYLWQDRKGSILMVSLWILIILTLLAVGIGWRTSSELRFVRIQRDRLKAFHLAKAGINKAIEELRRDTNNYDSLDETWSTGLDTQTDKPIFENVEIKEGSGETFTVRYVYKEEDDRLIYLCMADEERKININSALPDLLVILFKEADIEESDAQEITNYIRIWRGEIGSTDDKFKDFKKLPFTNIEELIVVLEYFYRKNEGEKEIIRKKAQDLFYAIKDIITVNSSGLVNINTASLGVLTILAKSVAKNDLQRDCVVNVVDKIIQTREDPNKGPFKDKNNIKIEVTVGSEDESLFNNLIPMLDVESNYFKIESVGNVGQIKKKITAIVKRGTLIEIVYWNES